MGSGASTLYSGQLPQRPSEDAHSKITVLTDESKAEFNNSALAIVMRILNLGERDEKETKQTQHSQAEPAVAKSTHMRASVLLMTKLIADTVPAFKSYTLEDPSKDELEIAAKTRQLLSNPESYLEFYTTAYKHIYEADCPAIAFSTKTIDFKNSFLSELMRLIVFEGSHKATFSERVRYFGKKHKANGIQIPDYGLIGEAVLRGMRVVQGQHPGDSAGDTLWPKLYSRFLRSLVPAMIIAESAQSGSQPDEQQAPASSSSADESMTMSAAYLQPEQDRSDSCELN